jgi:hypothetical protein
MSDARPIKDYLAAVDSLERGREEEALEHLAAAVGAGSPTRVMRNSISAMLTPGTRANDGILTLVANEVSKRRDEDG